MELEKFDFFKKNHNLSPRYLGSDQLGNQLCTLLCYLSLDQLYDQLVNPLCALLCYLWIAPLSDKLGTPLSALLSYLGGKVTNEVLSFCMIFAQKSDQICQMY